MLVSKIKEMGPRYIAQVVLASLIVVVSVFFSLAYVLGGFVHGAEEQSVGIPASSSRFMDTPSGVTYNSLLQTAASVCPQDRPFILLNQGSAIYQLADYYFYPRKVVPTELTDPFGASDLAKAQGGCLANFGPETAARLDGLRGRLQEIICSVDGCLYSIK